MSELRRVQPAPTPAAMRRYDRRWRSLLISSVAAWLAGLGFLGDAGREWAAGEERVGRRLLVGASAMLAGAMLLAAALHERDERDRLRRRVAPGLAPPPNL